MGALAFIAKTFGGNLVKDAGAALDNLLTSDEERRSLALESKKAEQNFQIETMKIEASLATAQTDINKEEAKSSNWFVAGWRPAVGWVCVLGLTYQFLIMPFLVWASLNFGWKSPPALETGPLYTLLTGMLGLAGMRTYEKVKDAQQKH
jgi:hypothetical protein